MKHLLCNSSFYSLVVAVSICQLIPINTCAQSDCTFNSFNNFIGTWTQVGMNDSTMAQEVWMFNNDSIMDGVGYMKTAENEIFSEKLFILCDNNGCVYIADVEHNPEPTHFKCRECLPNHFLFVNENHDFPTHIEYFFNGDSLKVDVYNSEKSSVFEFVRSAE